MTDLSQTIAPKSDQTNADDLIAGPLTITVTRVITKASSEDQPTSIYYDGDNGKPYKPCKSMRRVLVHVWGKDGESYIGRRMTLYRDPSVQFGGVAVGGIRISHMSDIDQPVSIALTANRASRKLFTVEPLPAAPQSKRPAKSLEDRVATFMAALKKAETEAAVAELWRKATGLAAEVEDGLRDIMALAVDGRLEEVRALTQHREQEAK